MKEEHYKYVGWGVVIFAALLCLNWSFSRTGPTAIFISLAKQFTGVELVQPAWILTFAVICYPAWLFKNYMEALAWQEHVRNMPKADARESAKKSKYVKTDHLPPAPPKPVQLSNIPEGQEEFVVTCGQCGQFFSAKKGVKDLKCPNCGEAVPVT